MLRFVSGARATRGTFSSVGEHSTILSRNHLAISGAKVPFLSCAMMRLVVRHIKIFG